MSRILLFTGTIALVLGGASVNGNAASAVHVGLVTPFEAGRTCLSKCDLQCPGEHEHRTVDRGEDNNLSSEPHPCEDGEANCQHAVCDEPDEQPTPDELNELLLALQEENREAIKGLMQRYSARIAINDERNALQVTGCDDLVIAHFPMSKAEVIATLN